MENIEIKVPNTEGVDSFTVIFWHRQEGDRVVEGEDLLELATEKTTFNITAPCSGKIIALKYPEGSVVNPGDLIAVLEKSEVKDE
ncbi:MAG: lipoyl domain-containing protein [Candidatus Kaelpia aquatica]|nr:lipoyl domain-containing protein [Candidatus Kaelpia aquatica]